MPEKATGSNSPLCLCGASNFEPCFEYSAPPKAEVAFQFAKGTEYRRDVLRCSQCGHFVSVHAMDISGLYSSDYVTSNYQDLEGIKRTFDRINSLPSEKSDNIGRVRRVDDFAKKHFGSAEKSRTLLDVGSGLGVFVYRMKACGWDCTALDPDSRSALHAEKTIGVRSICADYQKQPPEERFDVVTFNKVLEHVADPVGMLELALKNVSAGGFVYVEVPDGEAAALDAEGKDREEFTIDHLHVFSAESLRILSKRAGFALLELERLRDPSGKYTLRAFLAPAC